ncbi:protein unc-45 homolog A-like [Styela clava]
MHPECAGIQNFEAFMALTNLSAIDETHRRRIVHAKMTYDIETYMLEEHEMIRRAATETMCNMCMSPDFQEMMAKGGHDRLKILVLLLAEDDEQTRLAAAGALGILTSNKEEICKKIKDQTKAWIDNLSMTCLSENIEVAVRGCVIVHNVVAACKKSAEQIAESNILEILIVHSKSEDENKKKLKEIALKALKQLENDKFIQSTENEK